VVAFFAEWWSGPTGTGKNTDYGVWPFSKIKTIIYFWLQTVKCIWFGNNRIIDMKVVEGSDWLSY
jgi:hypothetical protein